MNTDLTEIKNPRAERIGKEIGAKDIDYELVVLDF